MKKGVIEIAYPNHKLPLYGSQLPQKVGKLLGENWSGKKKVVRGGFGYKRGGFARFWGQLVGVLKG